MPIAILKGFVGAKIIHALLVQGLKWLKAIKDYSRSLDSDVIAEEKEERSLEEEVLVEG